MSLFRLLAASEQVAAHLRTEISDGRLTGQMPGVHRLARSLGVHRITAEEALRQLEQEGLLESQGAGRRRKIVFSQNHQKQRKLRVAILLCEANDRKIDYIVSLQYLLTQEGHAAFYTDWTLMSQGMDPKRVALMVQKTEADAWIVLAGSYEILQWFSKQPKPILALFGRVRRLKIACAAINKVSAYADAAQRLVELKHRRIVILTRAQRRLPQPGEAENAFLNELERAGISVGDYNLPSWEETIQGLEQRLESLFLLTPPTAILVDEVQIYLAVQQFFARNGLRVPQDVSIICTDNNVSLEWQLPSLSYIAWESDPLIRRVMSWVTHVTMRKKDTRQFYVPATFVSGGTIAEAGQEPK